MDMTGPTEMPQSNMADESLLIVEDDQVFRERLEKAMKRFGFSTRSVESVESALTAIQNDPPSYAIVDLRLQDGNGLDVVDTLRRVRPQARSVVLTGYGNVPTAVAAVKAGAVDYLAKPVTADEVAAVLHTKPGQRPDAPEQPVNPDEAKTIHIFDVFIQCDENMSETSRKLNMHRRTLQRFIKRVRARQ